MKRQKAARREKFLKRQKALERRRKLAAAEKRRKAAAAEKRQKAVERRVKIAKKKPVKVVKVKGATKKALAYEKEAEEWVRTTNLARCIHGVPPVSWSRAVAKSAQKWANKGQFRHSRSYRIPSPAGPAGENLAIGHQSPSDANKAWYGEVDDCIRFPGCKGDHGSRGKGGRAIGHFTAMIWKGVKTIGCGQKVVKRGRWKGRVLYVCRYRAGSRLSCNTPNMRNCYRQNVPKPIRSLEQCMKIVDKHKTSKKSNKHQKNDDKDNDNEEDSDNDNDNDNDNDVSLPLP